MPSFSDFSLTGASAANFLAEYSEFRRDTHKILEEQAERIKALEGKIHVYEEVIRILGGGKTNL